MGTKRNGKGESMTTAIIRSCSHDDHMAHLCYLTMKKNQVADRYIFFHDTGENGGESQPLIESTGENVFIREWACNFGGMYHVKIMMRELQRLNLRVSDNDYVIFSDSDIIIHSNPFDSLPKDLDHAGRVGGELMPGVNHVSGQFNILKGWLWNKYINAGEAGLDTAWQKLLPYNREACADDTMLSVFTHGLTKKVINIPDGVLSHTKTSVEEYKKMKP